MKDLNMIGVANVKIIKKTKGTVKNTAPFFIEQIEVHNK